MKLPDKIEQELKIIGEFLETEEGKSVWKEFFENNRSRQFYSIKKKMFLKPPNLVVEWVRRYERLKRISKSKESS